MIPFSVIDHVFFRVLPHWMEEKTQAKFLAFFNKFSEPKATDAGYFSIQSCALVPLKRVIERIFELENNFRESS